MIQRVQQGQDDHTVVFAVDPGPNLRELECLEIMRKEGASKGDGEEESSEKAALQEPREECAEEAGVHVRGCWDTALGWRQKISQGTQQSHWELALGSRLELLEEAVEAREMAGAGDYVS